MAVSVEGSGNRGKSGRKPVDADLVLVPYIDLLTCMVAFLLITAVWSQLARLSVAQKGQGETDGQTLEHATRIAVAVHADGFNVIVGDDQKPIERRAGALDYAALGDELARIKKAHPDATDAQVLPEDGVVFDTIIRTMDVTMNAGFPDISLLDAGR
jgi:biopolymer transport protein ExbD